MTKVINLKYIIQHSCDIQLFSSKIKIGQSRLISKYLYLALFRKNDFIFQLILLARLPRAENARYQKTISQ